MKKVTLTLLIGALFLLGSCDKEEIKPSESGAIKAITEVVTQGANHKALDPVIEWGDTISESEGDARIARCETVNGDWKTDDMQLSTSNYNSLKNVTGAKGVGFSYTDSAGLIAFAVDTVNKPLRSLFYRLDDSGGTEIDTNTAITEILEFDNSEELYPGIITAGFDVLDDVLDQTGSKGFLFFNAFDEQTSSDELDIVFRAYDTSGIVMTDITGTTGGKECGTWMPASIHGSPTPQYHPPYWLPCGGLAQMVWDIFH
jgi:hypothetical protein